MKKKIISGIFALAILLIAGFGMNRSMNSYGKIGDIALKNVIALADGENPGGDAYETYSLIDYAYVMRLGDVIFSCTVTGIDCHGTGTLDCTPESTTNCEPT